MPRISILNRTEEFIHALQNGPKGCHLMTNVAWEDGAPEAIRLNLAQPNNSLRRSLQATNAVFPSHQPPMHLLNPSVLLTSEQLLGWQNNFAEVAEAVGKDPLGNVSINDPRHQVWLPSLQQFTQDLIRWNHMIDSFGVETELYAAYRDGFAPGTLLDGGTASAHFG